MWDIIVLMKQAAGQERRRHRRVPIKIQGKLRLEGADEGEEHSVKIENISEGGAFVSVAELELEVGSSIQLWMDFDGALWLKARIVLHHKAMESLPADVADQPFVEKLKKAIEPGYGVQFVEVGLEEKKFIRRVVLHGEFESEFEQD